jgi:hypothetical protein
MERMLGDVTDNFRSVLPFHALKESLQKPGPETRSDHRALGNDIQSVLAGLALVGCRLRWTALRVSVMSWCSAHARVTDVLRQDPAGDSHGPIPLGVPHDATVRSHLAPRPLRSVPT